MTCVLAWHFTGDHLRDGRPLLAVGETLTHTGPLVLCQSGLHASERIIDALFYAPGPIVHRVQISGKMLRDIDKLVAQQRTTLWRFDATDVLREFARRCALDVIHLWDAPEVVRGYLETGDESLRASARASAWASARAVAWASVWASAKAAVGAAAGAAAVAAARAAAGADQNKRLTEMIETAHASQQEEAA